MAQTFFTAQEEARCAKPAFLICPKRPCAAKPAASIGIGLFMAKPRRPVRECNLPLLFRFFTENRGVQDHCSNRLHGVAMREWAKKEKCVFSSASFAFMLFTSRCRALPPSVFCEEPLFLHGKSGEVQVHPAHFMALPREGGPSGSFRRAARIVRRCLRSMSQLFVENLFFIQNHKKAAEAFFMSASAANVMLFYS